MASRGREKRRARDALIAAIALASLAVSPGAVAGDEREASAREHFTRGVELLRESAWESALSEFLRSRELYPRPRTTINAAVCLRRLERYDEALEMVESLLVDFPDLPAETAESAAQETIELARLVGSIEITSAEAGATVVIDGRARGTLPLRTPLRVSPGRRVVRVSLDGFAPFETSVDVASGARIRVDARLSPLPARLRSEPAPAALEPPPASGARRRRAGPFVEIDGQLFLSPGFGGDVAGGCRTSCSAEPGLGGFGFLRAGVALPSGLAAGAALGGLAANQHLRGRVTSIQPVNLPPVAGVADDTLKLRGGLVGAWLGVAIGAGARLHAVLGAGMMLGSIGDSRVFTSATTPSYTTGPVGEQRFAAFVYVAPELRAGFPVSDHVELTAGIEALFLLPVTRPSWSADHAVDAHEDGIASFAAESLVGPVAALAPNVGVRYDF